MNFPRNFVFTVFFLNANYYCAKFKKANEWVPSNTGFRETHGHSNGEA